VSLGLALVLGLVMAAVSFVPARFSSRLRTPAAALITTLSSLVLLDLLVGSRVAMDAAADGRAFGLVDFLGILLIDAFALAGALVGAMLRARQE